MAALHQHSPGAAHEVERGPATRGRPWTRRALDSTRLTKQNGRTPERWRARILEHWRDSFERQQQVLISNGTAIAQRQSARLPGPWWPRAKEHWSFRSLVTLDSAAMIDADPHSDPNIQVSIPPSQPLQNLVKVRTEDRSHVDYGFHVRGIPFPFRIDYLFLWHADADVALNAMTFVQPNGQYALLNDWAAFADSSANVEFRSDLALYIQNPNGSGYTASQGTVDEGLEESIDIGWFDFLGAADIGAYSDEAALFDNNLLGVTKGSAVVFDVGVELTAFADGDAEAVLDFKSGDFGINVPAVYVVTFEKSEG